MMATEKVIESPAINIPQCDTPALKPAAKRCDQAKLDPDRIASVALIMHALCVIV